VQFTDSVFAVYGNTVHAKPGHKPVMNLHW